jgi:hypothetical protein
VNYVLPNQSLPADRELEEDPQLSQLRGTFGIDQKIHKLISWTTRKDYPTVIGISLPMKNWVGNEYHEIQFWEEVSEPIQFSHTAVATLQWLITRF